MTLSELAWEDYKRGVCLRILKLTCRIIEQQIEKLEEFLVTPEIEALSKDLQTKLENEIENLQKIASKFRMLPSAELLCLDISELGEEFESGIKRAISVAARRLRPLDQRGILETLKREAEQSPRADKT